MRHKSQGIKHMLLKIKLTYNHGERRWKRQK